MKAEEIAVHILKDGANCGEFKLHQTDPKMLKNVRKNAIALIESYAEQVRQEEGEKQKNNMKRAWLDGKENGFRVSGRYGKPGQNITFDEWYDEYLKQQ